MKKKQINPLIKALQFILIPIAVVVLVALFCFLAEWSKAKSKDKTEQAQKAEIEAYHRSEGRDIKFIEEIIGY